MIVLPPLIWFYVIRGDRYSGFRKKDKVLFLGFLKFCRSVPQPDLTAVSHTNSATSITTGTFDIGQVVKDLL